MRWEKTKTLILIQSALEINHHLTTCMNIQQFVCILYACVQAWGVCLHGLGYVREGEGAYYQDYQQGR